MFFCAKQKQKQKNRKETTKTANAALVQDFKKENQKLNISVKRKLGPITIRTSASIV